MVLTAPSTPTSVAGHRRSRSQTLSPSPIQVHHRSRSQIKARQKPRLPFSVSHSDPLDHDSFLGTLRLARTGSRPSPLLETAQAAKTHQSCEWGPAHWLQALIALIFQFISLQQESPGRVMTLQQSFSSYSVDFPLASSMFASEPSTPLHLPSTSRAFNLPERGRSALPGMFDSKPIGSTVPRAKGTQPARL